MSAPNSRGLPSGPIPSTRMMIRRASTVSTSTRLVVTSAQAASAEAHLAVSAVDPTPGGAARLALSVAQILMEAGTGGTYDVEARFRATSGSITAGSRYLFAWLSDFPASGSVYG